MRIFCYFELNTVNDTHSTSAEVIEELLNLSVEMSEVYSTGEEKGLS